MSANLTAPAPKTADIEFVVAELTDGKSPCRCSEGCPGLTTRFFSQGHDARLVTRLRGEVLDGRMTTAEAFAEILRRGGTERLQIKLDAAVANARSKPAKKARKGKPAKVATFELDGFCLQTPPQSTDPARAKVGRWTYEGTLRTHRSGETGAQKSDTFLVFEFTNKAGELVETTKFREAERLAEAPQAEAEVAEAPADLPIPVSLRGDASAEAAREEVAEARADDFADIPF